MQYQVCDVCDVPWEPEHFSLVVDKGTLDCVGMSRPAEPDSPWEDPAPPTQEWAESVFRMLKPDGFLVVVSCCFDSEEVEELLGSVDVLGSDEFELKCRVAEELIADNGSKVAICIFRKVPVSLE